MIQKKCPRCQYPLEESDTDYWCDNCDYTEIKTIPAKESPKFEFEKKIIN